MLHQDEGGIGKSIPDARKISQDPRDFPRAKPEGNLEGRGKSRGRRGWIFQYLPSFGGVRTFSSSSIHLQGWIRKSIPVGREGFSDPLPVEKLMLRDCPCSTKTREVLGNPSPLPSRFPSTLEISLGLRPREISRVSGNLLGVGDGFPNTSLVLMEHGYNAQTKGQGNSMSRIAREKKNAMISF